MLSFYKCEAMHTVEVVLDEFLRQGPLQLRREGGDLVVDVLEQLREACFALAIMSFHAARRN